MEELKPIKRALISVFDKANLEPIAQVLKSQNVEIYSTGGTARFLEEKGQKVTPIESVTQFPEMMEGRVKTLHPRVFAGLLARRDEPSDLEQAEKHNVPLFDLVIVNLYPFWEHLKDDPKTQSKFIDIGGPSMIRAAAKNAAAVTVLSDPNDYEAFLAETEKHNGQTSLVFRRQMAAKTFARTSQYDAMIATAWAPETVFPKQVNLLPAQPLRYGENPHQKAAWTGQGNWKLLQGKELSYNNILDAEAAISLALEFKKPAVAIIKHGNPCGAASKDRPIADVFSEALSGDPVSSFGGIVACNAEIDADCALKMSEIFLEVVIAPDFSEGAKEVFSKKKNLRILQWKNPNLGNLEIRKALGGYLVQEPDNRNQTQLNFVTDKKGDTGLEADLQFAWTVAKHVRSNAIVLARSEATLGIGAGQMSRVDAVELALKKSEGRDLAGSVLASDGFFPFRDNIERLKETGVKSVVQPGGSKRDPEVIAACNELGLSMAFTGERHFKH